MKVAVVGGGLGGLSAALFLARRGHQVVVLERDAQPPPATLDALGAWVRRGTPQAGQSHAFVARCRRILLAEAPDVLVALREAGVVEIALDSERPSTLDGVPEPDPDLIVMASRRPVFEWALRRVVEAEPGVTIRAGAAVAGLLEEPTRSGVPAVTGVGLEDGTSVPSDVAVDAAGRRSPFGAWLDGLGRAVPGERVVPCGIAYCSQFFERLGDGPRPALNRGYVGGGSFDRYSCLVFPGDSRTFSVTFGILPEDRALRSLHHDEGFLAAARSVPVVTEWLDPGEARPITSVATMRGLDNRFRSLVVDGRPAALGLLAVGDSACITNPAHTRGSTLAVASALAVARAIDEHPDPETQARAVDAHLDAELAPWFWDSVEQDAARLRRWRPQEPPDAGQGPAPGPGPGLASATPRAARITNAEANLAAQRDPIVWRAFTRAQQLLEMPDDVLADPDVVARTGAVLATGWTPPVLAAPSHDDLVEIATVAGTPGKRLDRTG